MANAEKNNSESVVLMDQHMQQKRRVSNSYYEAQKDSSRKVSAQKQLAEAIGHRTHIDHSIELVGKLLFGIEKVPQVLKTLRPAGQPLVDDWDCPGSMETTNPTVIPITRQRLLVVEVVVLEMISVVTMISIVSKKESNLKNVSCGYIPENTKCKMLHWCGDGVVAEGRIASTDPNIQAHHVPLGGSCWKVWVDRFFVEHVELIRSNSEMTFLERHRKYNSMVF